jgi:hypothetical protein
MSTAAIAANIPQAASFLVFFPVFSDSRTVCVFPVMIKLLSADGQLQTIAFSSERVARMISQEFIE